MNRTQRLLALISILALLASLSLAQSPKKQDKKQAVSSTSSPVVGSGAAGQMTKWTGVDGSNTYSVGDSNITEDKFGKVGVGTRTPTSLFTVRGVIETTLGGVKFPDGTTQTTAGVSSVFHDATLQGAGTAASPLGVAVPLNLSGTAALGVISATNTGNGSALHGFSASGYGVSGESTTNIGVIGTSFSDSGVLGKGPTGVRGLGDDSSTADAGKGVVAIGGDGSGVGHAGGDGIGAQGGSSTNGGGGLGIGAFGGDGSGVGHAGGDGIFAVFGSGLSGATDGLAGGFNGDVLISGKLMVSSGIKMFHIDHPLDPENKYLNHAAIESSEVLNVYSGNTTTDPNGDAIVRLPDWFEALNKDFRYQLTVIGTFAQAIIAEKIKGNRFAIKSNAPNVEVSWQVTGVRSDSTTRKYKFEIEEEKAEREKGYYLNPDVFNQPEEKSIEWVRHPEMMQRLKQQRLDAEAKIKKQQQR